MLRVGALAGSSQRCSELDERLGVLKDSLGTGQDVDGLGQQLQVVTVKFTLINAHETEDRLISHGLHGMGAEDSTFFILVDDQDATNQFKETLVLMDAFESADAGAVTVTCRTSTDKSVRVADQELIAMKVDSTG